MRLKLQMTVGSAVVIAALAMLSIATPFAVSAMATSTKSASVAQTTCHTRLNNGNSGHIGSESSSPCIIGNVLVECGLRFGACESTKSRYLKCKISAEKGKIVHFVEDPNGPIIGTRLENAYKVVTCKGSATILKVYIRKGENGTYVWQLVRAHSAHSLTIRLHWRRHSLSDNGLDIFAQH
jgi:hypothetical protein